VILAADHTIVPAAAAWGELKPVSTGSYPVSSGTVSSCEDDKLGFTSTTGQWLSMEKKVTNGWQTKGVISEKINLDIQVSDINSNNKCGISDNNCPDCDIKFDSSQSLEVHLRYHKQALLSEWAREAEQCAPPPGSPPVPVTTEAESRSCVSGRPVESPVVGCSAETGQAGPVATKSGSSMQISMAQSMGIQQGTAPHLTTHHQTTSTTRDPIFNSLESVPVSNTPSLPSINTDVSEFFSQLESHPDSLVNDSFHSSHQTNSSDNKPIRFPSYGDVPTSYPSPTNSAMSQAVASPAPQSNYQTYSTGGTFNESAISLFGQGPSDLPGSDFGFGSGEGGTGLHDQSSEEIWDMDSHTVRRYNPVPDPVSPGPIPTTPTMYGQQMQIQAGGKQGWESGSNYTNYSNMGGSGSQGQPLSPGQWMQAGMGGIKNSSVADAKRPKTYQCEACDKWFTSSGHLKRHFNTTLHKNAMKQKGDGYCDGMNGSSFSIPSVESGGAPSPCMSLGEESSQSSVCDDNQSLGQGSSVSGMGCTPTSTPGLLSNSQTTSVTDSCSPASSNTSIPTVPITVSPQLLSPLPDPGQDSSPLSGLSQLAGVPPPSPHSTTGLICSSPNPSVSPAQKNRFSPFRAGPPNNPSYKVQNLDQRTSYPSYPTTFQTLTPSLTSYQGDVYLSHQQNLTNSSYRNDPYNLHAGSQYPGQYHSNQYQSVLYSSAYDPNHAHNIAAGNGGYIAHANSFTDISNYTPMPADGLTSLFPDPMRIKSERHSPEGSEGSDSLKNENGEFRCNECNKVFGRICYLKQHNKSFHNGEKPYKCNQCGKRFPVEVLYQEHMAKHSGDKPYKCEVCPKQFNHKTDLRRHMCLHTGEKPFTCDVCGKGFIREDRMVKHADTHKKKAAHVTGGLM